MCPIDFEDEFLILTSPQPAISQSFASFTNVPIIHNTSTTVPSNNNTRAQRRTSNFFPPTNDNSVLSTPNIQVSTDSYQFPDISCSTTTTAITELAMSPFTTFNKTALSEPPQSPFYVKTPSSMTTSNLGSPVINKLNQANFNAMNYQLTNSLHDLHLQSSLDSSLTSLAHQHQHQQQHMHDVYHNGNFHIRLPNISHQESIYNTEQHNILNQQNNYYERSQNHTQELENGFMLSTNSIDTPKLSPVLSQSIWNSEIIPELPKVEKRENRYSNKVNNPAFIPSEHPAETKNASTDINSRSPKNTTLDNDDIPPPQPQNQNIKFPKQVKYTPRHNHFVEDMLNHDLTNRYSEGYSTTFYKRNKHGYMFIREATNTLHVHQNSWVQLKIKLPTTSSTVTGNKNNSSSKKLLSKKLKVNIKELPIWKPKP